MKEKIPARYYHHILHKQLINFMHKIENILNDQYVILFFLAVKPIV